MDKGTFTGLLLAIGGIVVGLLLEGGRIAQVLQPTAAMIVFGGTFGAVLVQFPARVVITALRQLSSVFFEKNMDSSKLVRDLVGFAYRARREGILSLDNELDTIQDPFLKKALMMAVDGTEPAKLRQIMELDLANHSEEAEKVAHVFEAAGGFAPTVGIIGAVLGLIQVMQHLQNIDEVGRGIAVAFVATIYGVGSANLLFLPSAGKLKIRSREEEIVREMMLEGVISILEGMNPRMLETKLLGYLFEQAKKTTKLPELQKA